MSQNPSADNSQTYTSLSKIFDSSIAEHTSTIESIILSSKNDIITASSILVTALRNKANIFWCGNGGSATDSQHLSSEFLGRFKKNRIALSSISLTSDNALLTSIANDYGYEQIFSRQIEGLSTSGDVLVVISTSGMSSNILMALSKAIELNLSTIALLGNSGGEAAKISEHNIIVPSSSTARIQEMHILIGHIICELVESQLGYA